MNETQHKDNTQFTTEFQRQKAVNPTKEVKDDFQESLWATEVDTRMGRDRT